MRITSIVFIAFCGIMSTFFSSLPDGFFKNCDSETFKQYLAMPAREYYEKIDKVGDYSVLSRLYKDAGVKDIDVALMKSKNFDICYERYYGEFERCKTDLLDQELAPFANRVLENSHFCCWNKPMRRELRKIINEVKPSSRVTF